MTQAQNIGSLQRFREARHPFETDKIRLESFQEKHIQEAYLAWFQDPETCRYNSHGGKPYTRENALSYLESIEQSSVTCVFAIYLKETDQHVGNISLNDISWKHQFGEISILIGEKTCWGKGVATDAVKLMLEIGFEHLGLHRLWVSTVKENVGMIRVAQKLGFFHEGILKEAFLKEGRFFDLTQWAILNSRSLSSQG